jgi:hypothetical protein
VWYAVCNDWSVSNGRPMNAFSDVVAAIMVGYVVLSGLVVQRKRSHSIGY